MIDQLQHEVNLTLASGARLTLRYFSDQEQRWIFSYDYIGKKDPGASPEVVNEVKLIAYYEAGLLTSQIELSMHVVIPTRLGQQLFAGVDISPGAETYLEFTYRAPYLDGCSHVTAARHLPRRIPLGTGDTFRLVEICKGLRDRVHVADIGSAIVRQIEFPFPIPDHLPIEHGTLRVPFRTNKGDVSHFDLPTRTLR